MLVYVGEDLVLDGGNVGKDAHSAPQHSKMSAVVTGNEFGISGGGRLRLSWAEFLKERSRDREIIWDCGRVLWPRRTAYDFGGETPESSWAKFQKERGRGWLVYDLSA